MTCALFGHKEWKKDASSAWIFFEWHRKFELCATNVWTGTEPNLLIWTLLCGLKNIYNFLKIISFPIFKECRIFVKNMFSFVLKGCFRRLKMVLTCYEHLIFCLQIYLKIHLNSESLEVIFKQNIFLTCYWRFHWDAIHQDGNWKKKFRM